MPGTANITILRLRIAKRGPRSSAPALSHIPFRDHRLPTPPSHLCLTTPLITIYLPRRFALSSPSLSTCPASLTRIAMAPLHYTNNNKYTQKITPVARLCSDTPTIRRTCASNHACTRTIGVSNRAHSSPTRSSDPAKSQQNRLRKMRFDLVHTTNWILNDYYLRVTRYSYFSKKKIKN